MKKVLFLLLVAINTISFAQTVTPKPIYKGSQNLTISEMLTAGRIYFGYQNPEYTTIVDIISFSVDSKDDALTLMNEAIKVLDMEKTARDQHIRHSASNVGMTRYGFNQKVIHISKLKLTKKEIQKIIIALESYNYQGERNINKP